MTSSEWRVAIRRDPIDVARIAETSDGLDRAPFQNASWLSVWRDCFGARVDGGPFLATLESASDGEIGFALPLALEHRGPLKVLRAWDHGVSDYNAPLVSPRFAPKPSEWVRLWHSLLEELPHGDLLEFEKCPADIGGRPNPLVTLGQTRPSCFTRHILPLDGGFEHVAETRFDQSMRRSLVRKRKKLAAKGRLVFTFETGAAALAHLDRLMHWRADRFELDLTVEPCRSMVAFYRALVAAGAIARVGALTLDGELVAGCFGTLTGSSFQLLAIAHDPHFNNWSAGLIAIQAAIEALAGEGVGLFDFTIGDEPYKHAFGVVCEPLWDLRLPLTAMGRAWTAFSAVKKRMALQTASIRRAWKETEPDESLEHVVARTMIAFGELFQVHARR